MPKPATPARGAERGNGPRDGTQARRQTPSDKPPAGNNAGDRRTDPRSSTFILSSRGRTDALRSDSGSQNSGSQQNSIGSDGVNPTAKLVIERGGRVGRDFPITSIETNIGRWDADSGIFPDVDLDEDDPEAKVSRRHARIVNNEGEYFIEDLGSTNGTFVNRGRRLLPGKRHMLQNGDEIIVGKTFLKFQILR
jgi:pSer/pThr/pTyr-binding forkhead associated (FHA) protein